MVPLTLPTESMPQASLKSEAALLVDQGSGHGVYSVVSLSRLACMFVVGGFVFVPFVRYN